MRLLFRAAFLLCGLLAATSLAPAHAAAQGCDPADLECGGGGDPPAPPSPPQVYIETTPLSYTGLAPAKAVEVSILWCWEGEVPADSGRVTLNGAVMTGFDWVTVTAGCGTMAGARSTGTVTLVPGAHVLRAEICIRNGPCGEDERTYTYTYLTHGIAVTPDEAVTVTVAGAQMQQAFTVHNAGTTAANVAFSIQTCSGAATACAAPATATNVLPGTTRTVLVPYTAGAAGSVGDIRLRGSVAGTSLWDEGTVQVSVPDANGVAAAPTVIASTVNPVTTPTPGLCVTLPAGPGASYGCGELRLAHAAPAVRTLGQAFAPVLSYNSGHADPRTMLEVLVRLPPGARAPDEVRVSLTVAGDTTETHTYAGGEWAGSGYRRVSIGFPTNLPTGFHRYTLEVTNVYGSSLLTYTGGSVLGIVNRQNTPFGAGWWMAGLEELADIKPDTVVWAGSDGALRRYVRTSSSGGVDRFAATAMTRPDTLVRDADGTYRRLLPNGAHVRFSAAGHHVATVTPVTTTSFFHDTITQRLDSIRVPTRDGDRTSHRFQYQQVGSLWRLSRIQRAYSRFNGAPSSTLDALNVLYALGGQRITAFVDPSMDTVRFAYEAPAEPTRITRRTDRMGVPTTFTYGAGGKLTEASTAMSLGAPVVHRFQPGETRGWTHSATRSETHYLPPGPEARTVRFVRNRYGAPTVIIDALGAATQVRYDNRFPALAVWVRSPGNRVTAAVYDDTARLVASIDSSHWEVVGGVTEFATTHYEYGDANWRHRPTRIVAPGGEETRITYDSLYGVRETITDVRGDSAKTTFTYRANFRLLTAVLTPENATAPTDPPRQVFEYDPNGNLARSTSPRGYYTLFHKDALGRDTLISSPIDGMARSTQWIRYDEMDRATQTRAIGPRRNFKLRGSSEAQDSTQYEELWTSTDYDDEGRTIRVSRWAAPDSTRIGMVITEWVLDDLGRVVSEIAPDSGRDYTVRDDAGRVTGYLSRRGHLTTMRYDRNDRLVERITPEVSYGPITVTNPVDDPWRFPLYAQATDRTFGTTLNTGSGLTIPGDTATFTYDVAGRMLTANNRDARITRTYTPAGLLETETQRIRPYAESDTGQHVYTLSYTYDLSGRRTSMTHPSALTFDGAPQTTAWAYDTIGRLDTVRHMGVAVGEFTYDLDDRIIEMRSGLRYVMEYDADGRLVRKRDYRGTQTRRDDLYYYDHQGRADSVHSAIHYEWSWNHRSGLGMLAWSATRDEQGAGSYMAERMQHDALGNVFRSSRAALSLDQAAPPTDLDTSERLNQYEPHTGRLTGTYGYGPSSATLYDLSGNRTIHQSSASMQTPYTFTSPSGFFEPVLGPYTRMDAELKEVSASYYGADERLRVVDRRTCLMQFDRCQPNTPPADARSVFEEHRYDALGRRILLRSRQTANCSGTAYCRSAITRTVWDGDQVLHEISAPAAGAEMERDTGHVNAYPGPYFHGRMTYVHGGGIDQPLVAIRHEYSDSLPLAARIFPQTNYRGQYDGGTGNACVTINQQSANPLPTHPEWEFPNAEPTPPNNPADGGGTVQHCVVVDWPGKTLWPTMERKSRWRYPESWSGSLLMHSRDPSGQYYRRNRFYDGSSGRFTQEDPIGIAGGLNVYGYANGDPISYSDPYGLSAECCRLGLPSPRESPDDPAPEQPRRGVLAHGASFAAIGQAAEDWWAENKDNVILMGATVLSRGMAGGGGRAGRLAPHPNAQGPHSTFRTNTSTGRVNHYETYRPQTNPRNPSQWERVKRVDAEGPPHADVPTPHTHRWTPRETVRPSRQNELP